MTTKKTDDLLLLGKLSTTFGIKGQMKLYSQWSIDPGIISSKTVYMKAGEEMETIKVIDARSHKTALVITIEGCVSIDEAEKLVGRELYMCAKDLPRENSEIYYSDLEGLFCSDEKGNIFGMVNGFIETPLYDLIAVKDAKGRITEIPFLQELIIEVDLEKGVVIWDSARIKDYYAD